MRGSCPMYDNRISLVGCSDFCPRKSVVFYTRRNIVPIPLVHRSAEVPVIEQVRVDTAAGRCGNFRQRLRNQWSNPSALTGMVSPRISSFFRSSAGVDATGDNLRRSHRSVDFFTAKRRCVSIRHYTTTFRVNFSLKPLPSRVISRPVELARYTR